MGLKILEEIDEDIVIKIGLNEKVGIDLDHNGRRIEIVDRVHNRNFVKKTVMGIVAN